MRQRLFYHPPKSKGPEFPDLYFWVDDGARTHDTRNHNPMLYQLNYIHHVWDCKGTKKIVPCKGAGEKNQSAAGGVYVPWRS